MEIDKRVRKCVKKYLKSVKLPERFDENDATNMTNYLVYKFHIDLLGDDCPLDKEDQDKFKELEMYKEYLDETVYKRIKSKALQKAIDARSAAPKPDADVKEDDGEDHSTNKRVTYEERPISNGRLLLNKVLDKMLDFSIGMNDWIIRHSM